MPKTIQSPAEESSARALLAFFGSSFFRPTVLKSTQSILRNFFFLQYKAALLPGRYPVSMVDHPIDEKIPFRPSKVKIYLEFLHFFIRSMGFLHRYFGCRSGAEVRGALESLGAVYTKAAEIYAKNFSTTKRPLYLARFKFLVIHVFDPHLMCIPSLHVMVVIRAYTLFRAILRKLGEEGAYVSQIENVRQGALAITEAVLYIKQHSINCISAAMYAMSRFDNLFPQEEAEGFARDLFKNVDDIPKQDAEEIRNHIIGLYRSFLKDESPAWEKPLLDFLESHPKAMQRKSY
jgi:hypothetical protein